MSDKLQFPTVSKPTLVGEFGNDYATNEVHVGRSKIRYLYESLMQKKQVNFDLNHGFESFQEKVVIEEKLDQLLKYIVKVSEQGSNLRKAIHDCDFVTWRGALTRIASSPYLTQDSDAWRIVCCKFKDVIFLCEFTAEAKLMKQANETALQKRQTYWGHKFEQYVSTDLIGERPDINRVVSTVENYCAVFKLQAKSQKGNRIAVFLGAEMDGIDSHGDFVEMKTQFQQIGLGKYWPQKEVKWWLQSYLVGIERLIVGLRNKDGIVERLQEVRTQDLRQQRTGWQPAICMNYLLDYLDNVRERLSIVPEGQLIFTEYLPSKKLLTIREVVDQSEHEVFAFITNFFIRHFSNK